MYKQKYTKMYNQKYEKRKMTQNRNKSSSAIADDSTQEQHNWRWTEREPAKLERKRAKIVDVINALRK